MTLKHEMTLPYPPDRVAALICSEPYNLEVQQAREDVIEARYDGTGDSDTELRYEVRCRSYKRTLKGSIDRGSTEQFTLSYRYDKAGRLLHWRHQGEESHRSTVEGVTRFIPWGDGTRLEREVTIDIRVPVIGKAIAKLVERELVKGFDEVERRIRRMLAPGVS